MNRPAAAGRCHRQKRKYQAAKPHLRVDDNVFHLQALWRTPRGHALTPKVPRLRDEKVTVVTKKNKLFPFARRPPVCLSEAPFSGVGNSPFVGVIRKKDKKRLARFSFIR
jgi:hypothetical protein